MRKLFATAFLGFAMVATPINTVASLDSSTIQAAYESALESDHPYMPSENAMADVDALLASAKKSGKLAMIIMGANWCHDSIGLISHMKESEVAGVVHENYEVLIVDVGYLESGKDIITRFGRPVIYGTPTVLVVEPNTERLLNSDTANLWRDAAAMDATEVASLFANQSHSLPDEAVPTGELKRLLAEIDAFEAAQAARIYRGFAIVGPMLAAENRPETFGSYWTQLRTLRYSITGDLEALRKEAHDRVAAGESDITLTYPDYPAFDWEE